MLCFCFSPVKSRPGQSSLSTGSSWTSAGPSIVSSPAWTGPPRSLLFSASKLNQHISQTCFAIIKMSMLKQMCAKALLIDCWNNLALHSYNALWLHSLSLTAFTFSHKSHRKSKLCPTQIVTYSEVIMICFLCCLRSFHAWFCNDFWQWLNTSSLFTGFTCSERNPYPCDLRLCIHKL